MKDYRAALLTLAAVWGIASLRAETPSEPVMSGMPSLIGTPKIKFDEPLHNFGTAVQGTQVKHTFNFKNVGTGDLKIFDAKGSCGCTAAMVSSGPFKPGEGGKIEVTYDSRGKFGRVYKDVRVDSNDPASPVMIALEGMIMEGAHPPMAAGETLFKGSCAECHSTPARGKMGKELYDAVCALCHDPPTGSSPHKVLAGSREKLAGLESKGLKKSISDGLPGTSMPAFSQKHGGPLSKKQIKSILEYLESLRPKK